MSKFQLKWFKNMSNYVSVLVLVLLASVTITRAQAQSARLASVDLVQLEGRPPVIRLTANGPLAFQVLATSPALELKLYGVRLGRVRPTVPPSFGELTLTEDGNGNLLVRFVPTGAASYGVRLGRAANIVEISLGT